LALVATGAACGVAGWVLARRLAPPATSSSDSGNTSGSKPEGRPGTAADEPQRPPGSRSRIKHGAGHDRRVYTDITQLLCDEDNPTPLVLLNRVTGLKHAKLYAKLEWCNPFGSVKDRVAANLIMDAEEKGLIGPDTQLVEPTSGNTGLGLIMMANAKGLSLTVPISKRVPAEKRNALRFMGAKMIELDDDL